MTTATELADAFNQAMNAHDAAKIAELCAENVTYWEANLAEPINGPEAVEAHFKENWAAFPDATIKVVNRIESGPNVIDEFEWSGTNSGPLTIPGQDPIPATGKRVGATGVAVGQMEAGKVKRLKVYYDQVPFMMQLGLMPQPETE